MLIAQRPTLAEEFAQDNRSRFVIEPLDRARYTSAIPRLTLRRPPRLGLDHHQDRRQLHGSRHRGVVEDVTEIILNLKGLGSPPRRNEPVTMYLRKAVFGAAPRDLAPRPVSRSQLGLHIAT